MNNIFMNFKTSHDVLVLCCAVFKNIMVKGNSNDSFLSFVKKQRVKVKSRSLIILRQIEIIYFVF